MKPSLKMQEGLSFALQASYSVQPPVSFKTSVICFFFSVIEPWSKLILLKEVSL